LLVAARFLFARRGFLGASIHEILRAAGVSRPVLYYHFGSKEGLFLAVASGAATGYEVALQNAAAGTDSVPERIRRLCRVHGESRRDWALLSVDAGTPPGLKSDAEIEPDACVRLRRAVEVLQPLVAEGIERRELDARNPEDAALALVGVTEVAAVTAASKTTACSEEDLLDRLLAVVFRGLGLRPQP
jgi:AcrR family transcriptional regulator